MIASLNGTIRAHDSRAVVIDVGGVGYRVYVGNSILSKPDGAAVEVFTHLHFAGVTIDLYGFDSPEELGLFQSLLKVSGVGPKSALSLLSKTPAEQLRQAIINADPAPLTHASGIGRKTAERIILELSGSLAKAPTAGDDEAIAALERLGYTRREADDALRGVAGGVSDIRERIRAALRGLSKKP